MSEPARAMVYSQLLVYAAAVAGGGFLTGFERRCGENLRNSCGVQFAPSGSNR
jgi:hypothetical protein